jgi:heme-degrading monooxygenase HmoA
VQNSSSIWINRMKNHPATYVLIWEFQVRAGKEREFERVYGSQGDWARFFAQSSGYLGTELHRDATTRGRYVTVDRWNSREEYETFRSQHGAEYQELDAHCEKLTERETPLGAFYSSSDSEAP